MYSAAHAADAASDGGDRTRPHSRAAALHTPTPTAQLAQAQTHAHTRPATAATEIRGQQPQQQAWETPRTPVPAFRGGSRPLSRAAAGAYATTAAAADLYGSAQNVWYRNGGPVNAASASAAGYVTARPRSGARTQPQRPARTVDPATHAAAFALTMGLSSAAGLALLATDPALVSAAAAAANANGAQSARPASSMHRQHQSQQYPPKPQRREPDQSWVAPTRPNTAPDHASFYSHQQQQQQPQSAYALPKLGGSPAVHEEKSASPVFGASMQAPRSKSRAGGAAAEGDQALRTLLLNASMLSSGAYCSFIPTPILAVRPDAFSNAPLPRRAFVGIAGGSSRPGSSDGLRLANHSGPGTVQRLSRTLPPANQPPFKPTYGITPTPPPPASATANHAGRAGVNYAQMLLRAQQAAAARAPAAAPSPDAFLFRAPYSKRRGPYGYEHSKRIVAQPLEMESSHQSSSAGSIARGAVASEEEVFDEETLVGAEVLRIAAAPEREQLAQIRASQVRADRARRVAEGGGPVSTTASTVSLTREEEELQYLHRLQRQAEESAALQRQLDSLHRRSQSSMDMAQIEALRAQLKQLPPPQQQKSQDEADDKPQADPATTAPLIDDAQSAQPQHHPRVGLQLLSPSQRAHFFASSRQRALDEAEASFQRSRSSVESRRTERETSKVRFADDAPTLPETDAENAPAAAPVAREASNWAQWDSLNSPALSALAGGRHARSRRRGQASNAVDSNSPANLEAEVALDSETMLALDRLDRVILLQSLWRRRMAVRRVRRRRLHLQQWVAGEQQLDAEERGFFEAFLASQGIDLPPSSTAAAVSAEPVQPSPSPPQCDSSELEMLSDLPSTHSDPAAADVAVVAAAANTSSAGPSSREMSRKNSVSQGSNAAAAGGATTSAAPTLRESKSRRKMGGLTAPAGRSRSTTPRPDSSAAAEIDAPPPLSQAAQLRRQLKAELEAEASLIRAMLLENAAKAQIQARHAEMARATRQARGNHQLLASLMNPTSSSSAAAAMRAASSSTNQRRASANAAASGSGSSVVSDDASDIGDAMLDNADGEVLYSQLHGMGLVSAPPVSSSSLMRKSSIGSMLDRTLAPEAEPEAGGADMYNAQLRKMGVTIDGSAESLRADQIGAGIADHIARWVTGFATSGAAAAAAKARAAATTASHRRNGSTSSSMTLQDPDPAHEIDMNFVSGASQLAGEGPLEPLPLSAEDQAFLQLEARNDALLVAALREAKQSPSEEERSRLRICQVEVALVLEREDSVILTQALARGRRARRQVRELREKLGATKSAKQARLAAAEAAKAEHDRRRAAEEAARQEGIQAARAAARAIEEAAQRKAQEDAAALALVQAAERRAQEEEDARREAQAAAAREADRVASLLASQHVDLETAAELAELAPAHFVLDDASPAEMAAARLSSGRCDRCSNGRASLWCESCQLKLCDDLTGQGCDSELHFAADKIKHHRVAWPIQPTEAAPTADEIDAAALAASGIDRACTASPSTSSVAPQSTHRTHSSSYPHFIDNVGTMIRPPSASAASAASRPQSASPAPALVSAAATASSTKCDHCRRNQASIWCEACGRKYCDDLTSLSEGCDGTLHLIAANRGHKRVRWDPIKFPAGRPTTTSAGSAHLHAPLAQVAESPRRMAGGAAADLLLLDSDSAAELEISRLSSPPSVFAAEDSRALCGACGANKAFIQCGACQKRLCAGCDQNLHAAGSAAASHERSTDLLHSQLVGPSDAALIPPVILEAGSSLCDYCASSTKRVYCEACFMSLCSDCETELHAAKSKSTHVRSKIEPAEANHAPVPSVRIPLAPVVLLEAGSSLCDYCASSSKRVYCEACFMSLCLDCETELHASKSKAAHVRTKIQPDVTRSAPAPVVILEAGSSLCDYCASSSKRVYCEACFMSLCLDCETELHAAKSRASHVRSKIEPDANGASLPPSPQPLSCDVCSAPKVDPAMLVWCESCCQRLCTDKCDAEVHRIEGRGAHIRTALVLPPPPAPATALTVATPATISVPAASVAPPVAAAAADSAPPSPSSASAAASAHSPTSLSLQRKRTELGLAPSPPTAGRSSAGADLFPHAVATRWSNGSWRLEYPVLKAAPHLSPSPTAIRAGVLPFDPTVDSLTWNRKLYAALDLHCIILTQCAWRQRQARRHVRQVRNAQRALLGSRN